MAEITPPPLPEEQDKTRHKSRPPRTTRLPLNQREVARDHGEDVHDWTEFLRREYARFRDNAL